MRRTTDADPNSALPSPSIRLGMVEAQHPRPTGTFYQRDLQGLRENGFDVHTFVLLDHDPAAWKDPAVLALHGSQFPDHARPQYAAFVCSWVVWRANARVFLRERSAGSHLRCP